MSSKKPTETRLSFECPYCKKTFSQQHRVLIHSCEKRSRWMNRDEKSVTLGFVLYQRFYELSYQKVPDYGNFADSKFYSSFIRFGRYLMGIHAIDPMGFFNFLLKVKLPMTQWDNPIVYENYIRELNKKETASAAVERNIRLMQQWADETGESWHDFFRKVSPAQATQYIRSGRVSPWLLYTAASAETLFGRLSEEQLMMIGDYIDPSFWKIKLERHPEDVQFIKQLLEDSGI